MENTDKSHELLKEKILLALKESSKKLVEFKKSKKTDLIVEINGKIVRINPNDIKL